MKRTLLRCGALALLTAAAAAGIPATPAHAQIVNGSFESGDFTGWTRAGFNSTVALGSAASYATYLSARGGAAGTETNAVVTAQTTAFGSATTNSAVAPTDGTYLAFLSTSATNNAALVGSSILQTFTVPAGATFLTLDLALLSNENANDSATYNDFGGVALTLGSTVLGQYNVNLNAATSADAHLTIGAAAGGFVDSSPYQLVSFDVSAYQGQALTLTGYVLDVRDATIETRLLIDNVTTSAVPEPATWALLALGGLGMIAVARQRLTRRTA